VDLAILTSLFAVALSSGTSIILATIGEILTERSGVVNLGLEGMMAVGAVTAFATAYYTGNLALSLLVSMLAAGLVASAHGFLCIVAGQNQTLIGIIIVTTGLALAEFLGQRLGPANTALVGVSTLHFSPVAIPVLSEIPILGKILFDQDPVVYAMYFIVALAWFFITKTKYGLHLRAIGENPRAADAMGLRVNRLRFVYTVLGGCLAGLGGAHLSLAFSPGWSNTLVGGRGWIAIALVIFSGWSPVRALFGAVLFGGISILQFHLQILGSAFPPEFLAMLPYLLTIIVLAVVTRWESLSKRVGAPAALGEAYVREK
jgi:general nucleoside transport system permease protein